MSDTLEAAKRLAAAGEVRISEHGYDELAEDKIAVRDIMDGLEKAIVVEGYPDFPKGPSVLVLTIRQSTRAVSRCVGNP